MERLLEARGVHKAYNAPVLVDFDFDLRPGELHALVGGNGAGKSTFARILCGLTSADAGEVRLQGHASRPASRREAAADRIVMVLQELNVLPTLTLAENLFLDDWPHRWGWIDRPRLRARAQTALAAVGLSQLDPDELAGRLGVGQQQLIEIAAALAQQCRVLILDEPTAALTAAEAEDLFERIEELKARGVGIIYVSHRMEEIRRLADRVTVLRDGRRIATRERAQVDVSELMSLMVGRETGVRVRPRTPGSRAAVALEVRDVRTAKVRGVSLSVAAGEVLGVAGLVGSGRTELLRAIYGADARESGEIRVRGRPVPVRHPADAVRAGIGMVPEDRKAHGLLLPRAVGHNASLAALPRFASHGWVREGDEEQAVVKSFAGLELKYHAFEQPVRELSGGNQQKAILSRWLLRDVEVLLLDEPTRGIDVAAKEVIYQLLAQLTAAGKAVVMVSSELPELMAVCDRIVVMSDGRLAGEFTPENWSEDLLNRAAFHHYAHG